MKKLLLTLVGVICSLGMWAKTATITWAMDAAANSTVAYSSEDLKAGVGSATISLGTSMAWNGTENWNGGYDGSAYKITTPTFSRIKASGTQTDKATCVASYYIQYNIQMKSGYKFTPTNVSFDCAKFGTGNAADFVTIVNGTEFGDAVSSVRSNNKASSGDNPAHGNITISNKTDLSAITVKIAVTGKPSDTKSYGIANVVISGTWTKEEVAATSQITSLTVNGAAADYNSSTNTFSKTFTDGTVGDLTLAPVVDDGTTVKYYSDEVRSVEVVPTLPEEGTNTYYIRATNTSASTQTTDYILAVKNIKTRTVTFAKNIDGVYNVNRMFPANITTTTAGSQVTLPNNYIYYKEGYTLTAFNDGTADYAPGSKYTINGDATLTPVFTQNTVSIATRNSDVTVTYDFNQSTNGGRIINAEGNAEKLITTATVDGETIDVAIDIDTQANAGIEGKNGKVNNTGGETAQANPGSVFYVPVEKGSVITIVDKSKDFSTITFDGVAYASTTTDSHTVVYTATEAKTVKIIAQEENMYYKSITVTYPSKTPSVSVDVEAASVKLSPYATTKTAKVKLTGNNLTSGTVTAAFANEVTGLSVSPASATVTDGVVSQDFTITYTSEADVIEAVNNLVFTAADDSKTATVAVTYAAKITKTTPANVTASTTWDWSTLPNTEICLSDGTNNLPANGEDFTMCDVETLVAPAIFNASALTLNGQYVYRNANSAKFFQGNSIKFTALVPGTVEVTFANTGNNAGRSVSINGNVDTEKTATTNTTYATVSAEVEAGEILIKGVLTSDTESAKMLRISKVVFTASASADIVANLNASGYATFSSAKNVKINGAQVYTAELFGTTITCHKVESNVVPAYTGVLLYSETASGQYAAVECAESNEIYPTNSLKATTTSTGVAAKESSLVLFGDTFVTFSGEAFAAGKAYLPYTTSSAKSFTIVFDDNDTPTAIAGVTEAKAQTGVKKYFKNGQLLIETANGTVNAAGAQVK